MKNNTKPYLPLHLRRGNNAETLAEKYLINQGLRAIESNYSCRAGEIDLLMLQANTLIFVEVRYRSNPFFGTAAESITPRKIQRIRKTAEHYLLTHRQYAHLYMRFDVVAISAQTGEQEILWIKDAF
ncbi:MAG: YraN family protein [Pseudomonadota bacterium]|nr:YraN family protein [Pseudomonadota bacterium]